MQLKMQKPRQQRQQPFNDVQLNTKHRYLKPNKSIKHRSMKLALNRKQRNIQLFVVDWIVSGS